MTCNLGQAGEHRGTRKPIEVKPSYSSAQSPCADSSCGDAGSVARIGWDESSSSPVSNSIRFRGCYFESENRRTIPQP